MKRNPALQNEMYTHYQNWQNSGLTQIGFCTLHRLGFHKFNYWVRKFERAKEKPVESTSGFLAVAIKKPTGNCLVEIIRLDGTRIQFHGAVEPSFIKSLLD